MSVAMIMSSDRLSQEHAMLNRIVVGLLDNGNQIIRIVSETEEQPFYEKAVSLAHKIEAPMPISMLLRNERKQAVVEKLQKANTNAIVAFGKDAMQLATDVHNELSIPILREVLSMKEARRIKKNQPVWRWLAPTPSIEEVISNRVGQERVAFVPMGVTLGQRGDEDVEANVLGQCAIVLDAGGDKKQTKAVLEALRNFPTMHVFLELRGNNDHKMWKEVQQLAMQDRVTCLSNVDELRQVIPDADVLVLPNANMPLRTVLLEAMAHGVPIACVDIPGFDMLIDEETALFANGAWENIFALLLDDTTIASRLAANSSDIISQKHSSSVQIAAFEAAFTLI
jgi:glycosyltransferase involved in cell wall biosynthesis